MQNSEKDIPDQMVDLHDRLGGINLYLIGLMGCGKSTVGRLLAQHLGYRFLDTDHLVEQIAQKSISDIFADVGEAAFRQLETQVLAEVSGYSRLAIATGGGIVLKQTNWSYLRHGIIVWLDAPIDLLHQRLQDDTTRPLLKVADPQDQLSQLLEQRRSLYAQADVQVAIDIQDTPEQVALHILEGISKVIKPELVAPVDQDSHPSNT